MADQSSHSQKEAACTLGRVSQMEIKSISNLVALPFPLFLDSSILSVVQPPNRVDHYHFLPNPPHLSPSHLKIPWMTSLFHHLRQRTRNPSRYLFTLWGNTKGYTSITHLSHKPEWASESSSLVAPSPLTVRDYPLKVSVDVPNDPIIWSAGTAFVDG